MNEYENEQDGVIPPSSLFVFWPGDEPPMAEEIRLRLADWGTAAGDAEGQDPEETLWSFWLELADRPVSFLIWCEQVTGAHLGLLDDIPFRSSEQRRLAKSCKWMVGVEGPISLRQPTVDYQKQLALCEAISRDWAPVIYDASAFQFRTLEDARLITEAATPPRAVCLYTVHRVLSQPERDTEARYWLHTHGLERAGIPDLDLFDIPESLLPAACELFESVADLWIEFSTPPPQTPIRIGAGLEIAWRPWQAAVADLPRDAVGGWKHRQEGLGHGGYRAVLVAPRKGAWMGKRWPAPIGILDKLARSSCTLYKTEAETRRMADRARERWGDFGMLFAGRHPEPWRFAVKLSFPTAGTNSPGEHLWFEVLRIQPGRVEGRLVSVPTEVRGLDVGYTDWFDISRMSDWRIFTESAVYDPETAHQLLRETALV